MDQYSAGPGDCGSEFDCLIQSITVLSDQDTQRLGLTKNQIHQTQKDGSPVGSPRASAAVQLPAASGRHANLLASG